MIFFYFYLRKTRDKHTHVSMTTLSERTNFLSRSFAFFFTIPFHTFAVSISLKDWYSFLNR